MNEPTLKSWLLTALLTFIWATTLAIPWPSGVWMFPHPAMLWVGWLALGVNLMAAYWRTEFAHRAWFARICALRIWDIKADAVTWSCILSAALPLVLPDGEVAEWQKRRAAELGFWAGVLCHFLGLGFFKLHKLGDRFSCRGVPGPVARQAFSDSISRLHP